MTTTEFSQAFDSVISAYNDSTDFGKSDNKLAFDEFEKSIFLTKAQDELVVSFYSGKNSYGEGFENTEEIRRYLSSLINTKEYQESTSAAKTLNSDSHVFILNKDTWFITYEAIKVTSEDTCLKGKSIEVVPITLDDLHKILKNPFKRANNRRALRLDLDNNSVEIIYPLSGTYIVRYLREPNPIIVDDLSDSLDIKGKHNKTECELHEALHRIILDRAIQMAIASRGLTSQK